TVRRLCFPTRSNVTLMRKDLSPARSQSRGMGRACGTLGPIARSKPVQAGGPTPKHNLGSRDSAWVRDGELVPLLHPNSGARSRVSDAARDTRPRVHFPEVRLSLAVRLRRMRPIEDLSRRRLLSASRCPRVRRVFARATGGPAALLGMVVLLLVAVSMAGDVRDLDVLDAGCGNGYLSRILAKQGARVVGVDLSPRLLAMANSHEARAPLGVRFVQADLAELSSLGAGTFDLVISNVVLQDVRRLDAALRELHRVLNFLIVEARKA